MEIAILSLEFTFTMNLQQKLDFSPRHHLLAINRSLHAIHVRPDLNPAPSLYSSTFSPPHHQLLQQQCLGIYLTSWTLFVNWPENLLWLPCIPISYTQFMFPNPIFKHGLTLTIHQYINLYQNLSDFPNQSLEAKVHSFWQYVALSFFIIGSDRSSYIYEALLLVQAGCL